MPPDCARLRLYRQGPGYISDIDILVFIDALYMAYLILAYGILAYWILMCMDVIALHGYMERDTDTVAVTMTVMMVTADRSTHTPR